MHLLRFSCWGAGWMRLSLSAVTWNDEDPLCLYALMLSPSTYERWSTAPAASCTPVQESSRLESCLWSRASKVASEKRSTIADYREICGLKALLKKTSAQLSLQCGWNIEDINAVTEMLMRYRLNLLANHTSKDHSGVTFGLKWINRSLNGLCFRFEQEGHNGLTCDTKVSHKPLQLFPSQITYEKSNSGLSSPSFCFFQHNQGNNTIWRQTAGWMVPVRSEK